MVCHAAFNKKAHLALKLVFFFSFEMSGNLPETTNVSFLNEGTKNF